jgi:hypothetical protein
MLLDELLLRAGSPSGKMVLILSDVLDALDSILEKVTHTLGYTTEDTGSHV